MNISEIALKSVAFLGVKKKGRFLPRATTFFVQIIEGGYKFDHMVTAEHVISALMAKNEEIWLRVNVVDGGAIEFPVDPRRFFFHPRADEEPTDVAVAPMASSVTDDAGNEVKLDIVFLDLSTEKGFKPTAEFARDAICLGGEVAIVGLFKSHYGQNRNVPIVRVGNIAAQPSEPIPTKYAGPMKAYLIEARSIAGLSGSPVFVLPDSAVLVMEGLTKQRIDNQGCALLGLMHGHFDVPNLNEDVVADDAEHPQRSINTGIGVVIPIEKIIETIDQPDLLKKRRQSVESLARKTD